MDDQTATLKKLVTGYKEMRRSQKIYFKTRTPEALKNAKTLESAFDRFVDGIQHKQTEMTFEFDPPT